MDDVEHLLGLVEPCLMVGTVIIFNVYLFVWCCSYLFKGNAKSSPPKGDSETPSKAPIKYRWAATVIFFAYYFGPLYYSTGGLDDLVKGQDPKLNDILALAPSILKGPSPPWMLQNRHLQFPPWMIQNEIHREGIPFERHELNVTACIDKGVEDCVFDDSMNDTVTLDIFPPLEITSVYSANFKASSPVVLFAPGLRCYSQDMPGNMIIRLLWAAGIRTVAINRRGHTPDQPLKAPRWNLFGDVDDLEQVYWHVKKNLIAPNTPMFLHGISSGCAVVVRALSLWDKRSETHPLVPTPVFVGAITLTPGYDTSKVLRADRFKVPYNPLMNHFVKDHFVRGNEKILRELNSEAVDRTLAAETLQDLLDAAAPFAGYNGSEAYYLGENPVLDLHRITTPTFVMNSLDDPCCAIANLYEVSPYPQHGGRTFANIVTDSQRGLIAVTKTGSHCPFLDGTFFPFARDPLHGGWMLSSWADTASVEFYKAALTVYGDRRFK